MATDQNLVWDLRKLYTTGSVTARAVLSDVRGDFDGSGQLSPGDIDLLSSAIHNEFFHDTFDLSGDGRVDSDDRIGWIEIEAQTWIGDSNLDGEFNSRDLIQVFAAAEYEDGQSENSTWTTGDWNGDFEFNSSDLVSAFQHGGYENGKRQQQVMVVPEITATPLSLLLMTWIAFHRRKTKSVKRVCEKDKWGLPWM